MTPADATRPSLLVRIRDARDREAWGQFVEIYAPLVYDMARRRGLQDADAADLTQEVLRSVSAAIGRLDYDPRRGTFRGWLFTVTRNALNTYFESRRRLPRGSGDSSVQEWLENQPGPDEESAEWDRDYQRRVLDYATERARLAFEDATWQAFALTAIEGKAVKDVAAALGTTVGAVYIARSRVLGRIKDEVRQLMSD